MAPNLPLQVNMTFVNLAAICYFEQISSSVYLKTDVTSGNPDLIPASLPFTTWEDIAYYRFRLFEFKDGKTNSFHVVLRNEKDRKDFIFTNGGLPSLARTQASLYQITRASGSEVILKSGLGYMCPSGSDVIFSSLPCPFRCQPSFIQFYSSDLVHLVDSTGQTIIIVNGQVVAVTPPTPTQTFSRAKRSDDIIRDMGNLGPGNIVMYKYRYPIGNYSFHAAMLYDLKESCYLACGLNQTDGAVSGLQLRYMQKGQINVPETVKEPDERLFILEHSGESGVIFRCHQDPVMSLAVSGKRVILSNTSSVFHLVSGLSDVNYDEFSPAVNKDKETCTPSDPWRRIDNITLTIIVGVIGLIIITVLVVILIKCVSRR